MSSEGKASFYEVEQALIKLGKDITEEAVNKITGSFLFDEERDDGMLMISLMAMAGQVEALAYLVDKKANPNLESWQHHYHRGPALLFALLNNISPTTTKVKAVKILIEGGADVNRQVQWFDSEKEETKVASLAEYGLTLAMNNISVMNDPSFDTASRKDSVNMATDLYKMLEVLLEAGADFTPKLSADFDLIADQVSKFKNKRTSAADLTRKAHQILDNTSNAYELAEGAREVCFQLLDDEKLMPTQAWANIVRHLVEISLTFEDVSTEVYGQPVSFDDDEGWLCQGWENYVWLGELMELLSNKAALKNKEWDVLVLLILKMHSEYDADIEDEIENLLETPWVQKHQAYDRLKEAAEY